MFLNISFIKNIFFNIDILYLGPSSPEQLTMVVILIKVASSESG